MKCVGKQGVKSISEKCAAQTEFLFSASGQNTNCNDIVLDEYFADQFCKWKTVSESSDMP